MVIASGLENIQGVSQNYVFLVVVCKNSECYRQELITSIRTHVYSISTLTYPVCSCFMRPESRNKHAVQTIFSQSTGNIFNKDAKANSTILSSDSKHILVNAYRMSMFMFQQFKKSKTIHRFVYVLFNWKE